MNVTPTKTAADAGAAAGAAPGGTGEGPNALKAAGAQFREFYAQVRMEMLDFEKDIYREKNAANKAKQIAG